MSRNQLKYGKTWQKRDKPRARPRARTQSKPSLVRTEREKENPEHISTERESENLFGKERESGHLDWEGETERERSENEARRSNSFFSIIFVNHQVELNLVHHP